MKVFFTAPTSNLIEKYPDYSQLIDHIEKLDHQIVGKWIDDAYQNLKSNIKGNTDLYYREKIEAINRSDIIIADGTEHSIGVSHQITLALQKSKPVLLLISAENKNDNKYIEAIKSKWLRQRLYNNVDDAKVEISDFLNLYRTGKKSRFNLVISGEENGFLESRMKTTGRTKTELIRNLIRAAMEDNSIIQ